jgi:hypothetical protein
MSPPRAIPYETSAMTRATTLIIAAFLCSAAASSPLITFESP